MPVGCRFPRSGRPTPNSTAFRPFQCPQFFITLVVPNPTPYLLTRQLPLILLLAALIGALSRVTGLYLLFHVSVPSGVAIVLVFLLVFSLPLRGRAGVGGFCLGSGPGGPPDPGSS
jgi:hypothetical protein